MSPPLERPHWGMSRGATQVGVACSRPVIPRAIPATSSPTTEPVVTLAASQVPPHSGTESETRPVGIMSKAPSSGPRSHQRLGQIVMPTKKPIASRET